jgi:hypothetical protein
MINAPTHDFRERLAWSEEKSCEPFWEAVYRKAFPNMVGHMLCGGSNDNQRRGVDRVIQLANGHTLYVDEKKRAKDYTDILLEYVSVSTTGAPGWMDKDLAIDYLAYAFMPSKRVYLFPWHMLRRAWLHHRDEWIEKYYPPIKAQNNGYETLSVAVPIKELRAAVHHASLIDVSVELAEQSYV